MRKTGFGNLWKESKLVSLGGFGCVKEKKIKENHAWFVDTVSLFKPPNQKSGEALDASRLKTGLHQITVETDKKEAALKITSALCLDEVMLQYYLERQCLMKCTRQIIMQSFSAAAFSQDLLSTESFGTSMSTHHILGFKKVPRVQLFADSSGPTSRAKTKRVTQSIQRTRCQDASIVDEAQKLISDGPDRKLFSVLQENLSSNFPENMVNYVVYSVFRIEVV
ncbi:hypothetical protein RND71_039716 [Anisodus tanguticus]|uniref:Uncharacterized protein n=1 Tax=Anisodus tanguticus TaxID=243964 RepID=A0AAE1UY12_9SOLA|nr:hypothetical protein RND71_039716 [Anisodus tanguticus]